MHTSKIVLAGITLPPNYGPDYIQSFEQVFRDLASKHQSAFVPMIYKDLIQCARNDSVRWHSSHGQGLGNSGRNAFSPQ